ncbi:hypothetical protein D9M72_400950 [compost metagenome]
MLGPEGRSPCRVQGFDAPVPTPKPAAEGGRVLVPVKLRNMAAEFVVHMPQRQCRVVLVALCQHPGDAGCVPPVNGRRRRVVPPGARAQHGSVSGDREDLRVLAHQPCRGRGGCGREGHLDACCCQVVQDVVQPAKIVVALGRFQQAPGKNAHAEERDAGFLHEVQVLQPGADRPLLGVVVAPVGDTFEAAPHCGWSGIFLG